MNQPHPHAASMLLYAQDAAETDKPWERWEFKSDMGFHMCLKHPEWNEHFEYRRKPRTITINGIAASLSAQAEGWRPIETAPKGERVLLWSEITRGEPFIGDWAEYARYNHPQFTHWSRWDGLPHTSAEGVEHG